MQSVTLSRLKAAIKKASAIGWQLTESGAPRGERRYYCLIDAQGKMIAETSRLATIEAKLEKE